MTDGDVAMRIASFNVANLFARAKALNLQSWAAGKPAPAAQAELNALLQESVHPDAAKARILQLLASVGLQRSDDSEFVRLRKIRGQLLRRPRAGPVQVVAGGLADWIGWVELKPSRSMSWRCGHTQSGHRTIVFRGS